MSLAREKKLKTILISFRRVKHSKLVRATKTKKRKNYFLIYTSLMTNGIILQPRLSTKCASTPCDSALFDQLTPAEAVLEFEATKRQILNA